MNMKLLLAIILMSGASLAVALGVISWRQRTDVQELEPCGRLGLGGII
jgi:hypothetical protein